jgi:hypothetical protein
MDVPDWYEERTEDDLLNIAVAVSRENPDDPWLGAHFDWSELQAVPNWTSPAIFGLTQEVGIGQIVEFINDTTMVIDRLTIPEERLTLGDKTLIIGRPGVWEIVTFDAWEPGVDEFDGLYILTGVLRGQFGPYIFSDQREPGDTVVFAEDTKTVKYTTQDFRAKKRFLHRTVPTFGRPEEAEVTLFYPLGNSRRPYPPKDIFITRLEDGDVLMQWEPNDDRFGGEPDEIYSLDIYDDEWTMLRRVQNINGRTFLYRIEDQTVDGLNMNSTLNVLFYQMNASHVGRGFPAGGTLPIDDMDKELSGLVGPVSGPRGTLSVDMGYVVAGFTLEGAVGPIAGLSGALTVGGLDYALAGSIGPLQGLSGDLTYTPPPADYLLVSLADELADPEHVELSGPEAPGDLKLSGE